MSDAQGLVYDPVAEDYERGRTGWPAAVADGVDGDTALDLAAGTGKLTRVLIDRFPRVVAVEPLAAMRALGERLVPAAEWLAGTAEKIPRGDASFDAAFVAEAFHWFDSRSAVAELARVLRPGGTLVVCFTAWDAQFEPGLLPEAWRAVEEVSARSGETGGPKVQSGDWRAGFDGAPFTELEQRDVPFEHVTDRGGVIAYYLSISTIAARPQGERDALHAELKRLVPAGEHRLRLHAETFEGRRR